ncbi:MAG: GGDEF domain-containing protein [Lachnospiraceae bacterium]|nr:GGDEF domain-containing protein [Lachnospiraceae bacterium]
MKQIWDQLDSVSRAAIELYKVQIPEWTEIDEPEKAKDIDLRYMLTMAQTSQVDISLFIGNKCVASTIDVTGSTSLERGSEESKQQRNTALSSAAEKVPDLTDDVMNALKEESQIHRDSHQKINGKYYFVSYIPIHGVSKKNIGAIGVSVSARTVNLGVWKYIGRSFFMSLIFMILFGVLVVNYSGRLSNDINSISKYMNYLTKEDFTHKLPDEVLKRNDEVGELGEYSTKMGAALNNLIRNDQLTGILNRRAGQNQLSRLISRANTEETRHIPLCVGMADIDFFKKVNDTYGHATGDEVLKKATQIMKNHLGDNGFVCRWGGEEFLMAANVSKDIMHDLMMNMLEELRATEFTSEYKTFRVTMTMGFTQYHSPDRLETCVEIADRMLYSGKQNGRNQVVVGN